MSVHCSHRVAEYAEEDDNDLDETDDIQDGDVLESDDCDY